MTLMLCAAVLLIVGNLIASRGDVRRAASPYNSAEYDRAFRWVSVGTAINLIAAVLLVIGIFTLETPFIYLAIGTALLWWAMDAAKRTAELEPGERSAGFIFALKISGVTLLCIGGYSLLA